MMYLSIYLSIYLSVYLSIYLSIYPQIHMCMGFSGNIYGAFVRMVHQSQGRIVPIHTGEQDLL